MSKQLICLSLTHACNHTCTHCCKAGDDGGAERMTRENVDRALALEKRALLISGGEPGLAKDDLFYIIERETARVTLNTNLTLFTAGEIGRLIAANVEITPSVPSLDAAEYAAITGAGDFETMRGNLALLPKGKPVVVVAAKGRTKESLLATVDALVAMGFERIRMPVDYTAKRGPEKKTIEDTVRAVMEARPNVEIRIGARDDAAFCNDEGDVRRFSHICDAGLTRFAIRPNGDITPCSCLATPVLGNIETADWTAIRLAGVDFYSGHTTENDLCKRYETEE